MILEGFIAMVWAAGAMGVYNLGLQAASTHPWPPVPSSVVLPKFSRFRRRYHRSRRRHRPADQPSGDTALRALRMMIADAFPHRPGVDEEASLPCGHHLYPGGCHPHLREDECQRIQYLMALFRMGQPDAVSLRVPGHRRLACRERRRNSHGCL